MFYRFRDPQRKALKLCGSVRMRPIPLDCQCKVLSRVDQGRIKHKKYCCILCGRPYKLG